MERLKGILRWSVGIVIAVYLVLALSINIPAVQSLIADATSNVLGKELNTHVEIGRVQLGFNGRIIMDDVAVDDQKGGHLLRVSRMGSKIDLWELLEGRIRLGIVQLFGMRAVLYQETEDGTPNFQFIIDAFNSDDTTKTTPLDLYIGQILIRRTNVSWERKWKEETPGVLNSSHLSLENLNATAELNALTNDSLNLELKRLDVTERISGLSIKKFSFDIVANKQGANVSDLHMSLPHSNVDINELALTFDINKKALNYISMDVTSHVESQDIKGLLPFLTTLDDKIDIKLRAQGPQDNISIDELRLSDTMMSADIQLNGRILNISGGWEKAVAEVFILGSHLNPKEITQFADIPVVEKIGDVELEGRLELQKDKVGAELSLTTTHGEVEVKGTMESDGFIDACVQTEGLMLSDFMDNTPVGMVALNAEAKGKINGNINVRGAIPQLEYKGYCYKNIDIDGSLGDKSYEGGISLNDENISLQGRGKADLRHNTYVLNAHVENFEPNKLNLTERFPNTRFSAELIMDVTGRLDDNIEGVVYLNGFKMKSDEIDYRPGDIHITARYDEDEQMFTVISPFLEAQLEGKYKVKNLAGDFMHLLSLHAPTLMQSERIVAESDEYCSFVVRVYDTQPLQRLMGMDIEMGQTAIVEGSMDVEASLLELGARVPQLRYGKEVLKDMSLRIEGYEKTLLSSLQLKRLMKGTYVDFGFEATGFENDLSTKFYWDNNSEFALKGDINVLLRFDKDQEDNYHTWGKILPSTIVTGDSVWHVRPGSFSYHEGILEVDSFSIGSNSHNLAINGRVSKEEDDTLHASLRNIDLENIFTFVNFNAVEFGGEVTGDVYAHSLFGKPYVDADVRVRQFALNSGIMGDLNLKGNWGRREYSIYLDGAIKSGKGDGRSHVRGYITPKKDVSYHGLDLGIEADTLNVYFLNKYTHAIFDELQGNASGYVHLFGPFKQLNVEGDLLVHKGSLGIPYLGVRYDVVNDSIKLTPNNIYFTDVDLYDPQGKLGNSGHSAKLTGHLVHSNFSRMSYDINIRGDNLLAYNFKDFDDMPFCGTVLVTGDVEFKGSPGQVNIDIKAQPQRGTSITYDFTSPDNVEQSRFVTYVDHNATELSPETVNNTSEVKPEGDIHINFDLDIDNNSTMNLLMDAKSGDMITVNGRGHMLARYYNKGSMQIFGTYRIEKGTYNLSLQEIIHKNFDLQDGSTIVFTGEPLNADLNIQASHTVSGVSLNDISARSTFSNTSARVNCLMNITGKASQPYVTFDFDILNVNEDEKQMVRSLISTEEERNMQVIYLLGIGRFYTYDYSNTTQSQSSTAMNSLLSSTLSGQLNQMLSNMINNSNWNFGANVNTGTTGWSDLDVEGMLQGSLLNDRLLINGNFGYRDNPVNSSNFIGDFDAQYHLTRSGSVSLKAYNETNDRYFTKTSLTTQGIGILLKKDFSTMHDLFNKRTRKPKADTLSPDTPP